MNGELTYRVSLAAAPSALGFAALVGTVVGSHEWLGAIADALEPLHISVVASVASENA